MHELRLLDVTLDTFSRAVGISFDDKLARAEALAASGIDVLDTGEPLAVPGKLLLVREIAHQVRAVAVAARAQANMQDIQTAWRAIGKAEQPVLRICSQISDWHRQERLRVSEQILLQHLRAMLAYARQFCPTVELVALDATRCQEAFLCQVIETAISIGARTVTLVDSVGYALPFEYRALFRTVVEQGAGSKTMLLGTQAHNRDGYALDNTLAAICAGARLVTVDESSGGHLGRADLAAALQRQRTQQHTDGISTREDPLQPKDIQHRHTAW